MTWIILVNKICIQFSPPQILHSSKIHHFLPFTKPKHLYPYLRVTTASPLSMTTLLTFPHFPSNFPSLSRFPNNRFSPPRRLCSTLTDTAIVWFKHDLRTDDHPGLLTAASNFQSFVPIYVFDHRILSSKFKFKLHNHSSN